MKRVAYEKWRDWVVIAFGSQPPEQEEWSAYTGFLRANMQHRQRGLVLSQGGSLEPQQRRDLDALLGPHKQRDRRIAVVTSATFTWGFVKALSVFDPSYRAFRPAEMDQALRYIEVPPHGFEELRQLARVVEAQVG